MKSRPGAISIARPGSAWIAPIGPASATICDSGWTARSSRMLPGARNIQWPNWRAAIRRRATL